MQKLVTTSYYCLWMMRVFCIQFTKNTTHLSCAAERVDGFCRSSSVRNCVPVFEIYNYICFQLCSMRARVSHTIAAPNALAYNSQFTQSTQISRALVAFMKCVTRFVSMCAHIKFAHMIYTSVHAHLLRPRLPLPKNKRRHEKYVLYTLLSPLLYNKCVEFVHRRTQHMQLNLAEETTKDSYFMLNFK